MEGKSTSSSRTRSKSSSSSSKALAARAELEMAKANLLFMEKENRLREAKAKIESDQKTLDAEREVAIKEAAVRAFEEDVSGSERGSIIHVDQTPADPMQRTQDYVAELPTQPPVSPHSYHTNPQNTCHSFQGPKNEPSSTSQKTPLTDNHPDHSGDLMRYFARRELLQASMLKFSDQPKDYRAWRRSFRNSIIDMQLNSSEEMDLLVRWLGPSSSKHANRLRTAYLNYPDRGLQEIWKRLDKCYGAPEVIEDSLFDKLHQFPRINRDYFRLRELSDLLTELQAAKEDGDLPGLALLDTARGLRPIVEKLPPTLQDQWTSHGTAYKRKHQVPFPPFSIFAKFVEQQADDKNDPSFRLDKDTWSTDKKNWSFRNRNGKEVAVSKTQIASKDVRELCPIHNLPHPLRSCRVFKNKPLHERHAYLRQRHICSRCFSSSHAVNNCHYVPKCAECGSEDHHTALHPEHAPQSPPARAMPHHGGEKHNIETHCTRVCGHNQSDRSCSKICLVTVYPKGQRTHAKRMYAILDEHSNKSLARPEFFELFDDHGPISPYSLRTCAGVTETNGRRAHGYQIESMDGNVSLPLPTLIECSNVPNNRLEIPTPEAAHHHKHLFNIAKEIPELDESASILLLLGRDIIDLHKVRVQLNGPPDTPYAQKLDMGWVIVGNVCLGRMHKPSTVNTFFTNTREGGRPTNFRPCPNSFQAKERFYKTELGRSVFRLTEEDEQLTHSIEDEIFLDIMKKGVQQNSHGSWVAPLPLKPSRPQLPNNRQQAVSRFNSLTRQFKRKPQLEKDFFAFMKKIFEKGQAEIAPPLHANEERWYLPMFGIYHPKKPGKIRVVFDSSAQHNGVSLNDALLSGPDLYNNLVGVLLRFRRESVAIMADIEQMFFCFLVKREHRNLLRFLWYKDNDPSKEPIEYRMTVHVFGNSPSPAVATYCLRKSVGDGRPDCNPAVVQYVHRDFYVDDGLKSVPTVADAISLLRETQEVLAASNLRLHKIASNKKDVLDAFPTDDLAADIRDLDLDQEALPMQRSLGLDWDPKADCFTFRVAEEKKPYTRRGLLSTINSLYDPLGFVAPVIVQGKVILRELTSGKVDWDTPLQPQKEQRWTSWRDSLQELHNLRIPRTYTTKSPATASFRQLCVFSDASITAIAAVAYLRVIYPNGDCEVGFVMGKTKLAPQPETTVPRLELCAAVLAVELTDMIRSELEIQVNSIIFFTDSKVVLGYISNEHRRFYVYVANRIRRIRRSSQPEQWHYVPTDKNPADSGTRSVSATQLSSTTWLQGPPFISKPTFSPTRPKAYNLIDPEDDTELRPLVTTFASHLSPLPPISHRFMKFSTWKSLNRAIAHLIHISQTFHRDTRIPSCKGWHHCKIPLSPETLAQSASVILRTAQNDVYALESSYLAKDKQLPESSALVKLDPYVDDQGLLRIGGRTRRAGLDRNDAHPIILSGKHHIATLLVRHHHQLVHHQGRHFTEGAVRAAGFWIVGGKRCISKIIHQCVICRKLRGSTETQKMADLPEDRLSMEPPFTNVGLDVFGPWPITSRRTRGGLAHSKRWAVLFTCMTTRAVHIEVLESMDTSALINALRRFFSIRGPAKILRSDQGSNFVGANKELEINNAINTNMVRRHLSDHGCTWLFNPPHAPHMGGVWERMIGITKRILNSMLLRHESTRLTHEVLITFLAEAAAIINNRPLVPVSSDPEDPLLLTPSTLLTQKTGFCPAPPGNFDPKDMARRQWRHVQHLAQTFWKRWKGQYLPLLQARSKWTSNVSDLKPGSVVLVKDQESERNEWPLGLITRAIHSKDGRVRQVEVKLHRKNSTKLFLRPVTETVLLLPPATPDSDT